MLKRLLPAAQADADKYDKPPFAVKAAAL